MTQLVLSELDKQWIEYLIIGGTDALLEQGLSPNQIDDFLARKEVRASLDTINAEFGRQEVVQSVTRFGARRHLARMIPESLKVLRLALLGPEYAMERRTDSRGESTLVVRYDLQGKPIVSIPEVTPTQMKAAAEVLDRTGVAPSKTVERHPNVDLHKLLKEENVTNVTVEEDPTIESTEQRTLSRERVRLTIDQLAERIIELRDSPTAQKLFDTLAGKPEKKKKKKKKLTTSIRRKKNGKARTTKKDA